MGRIIIPCRTIATSNEGVLLVMDVYGGRFGAIVIAGIGYRQFDYGDHIVGSNQVVLPQPS